MGVMKKRVHYSGSGRGLVDSYCENVTHDWHNADAALKFALSLSNAIHLLQARTQLAHEHLFKDMRTGSCNYVELINRDPIHADIMNFEE